MDKQVDKWECLVCLMKIGEQPVNFQIDTGSSVNILPVKFVRNFKETETILKTWKNEDYKPLGETRVVIRNPKNKKNYNVNFIITIMILPQF